MSDETSDEELFPASFENTGSAAVSEIDEEFEEEALKKIKAIFIGNGIKEEDIKCVKFDGSTLEFLATTTLKFRLKVLEHTEAGKKPGPKQISGKAQLEEEKLKQEQKITHRADSVKRIQTYIVEQREDMGYGLDGQMIKLPFLYTDYVQYEACKNCRAQGKVQCQRCHGQGLEMCQRCNGQGLEMCPQCNGSQFMQGPNGRVQCQRCYGKGKVSCSLCNEKRKIQCRICKTKGTTVCTVCNGHAWNSHIYNLEIDAMPSFDYDRSKVKERIGKLIDKLGPELVDHANIHPIFKERDDKDDEDQRDFIAIPYIVKLPFGDIQFSIGDGDTYNALIFGYNCELHYMPYLLDKLLKKPMARLEEAAQSRGDVAAKIRQAAEYRTLKQAILYAARMPLGKAMKKVKHENPIGIRNDSIKKVVQNADRALKNITKKPRQTGLIIGIGLMAAIFGGYFAGGLRDKLVPIINNQMFEIGADAAILGLTFYIALMSVKFMGRKAIMTALSGIVPQGQENKFMPKAGKTVDRLLMITPLLYAAMVEASVHVPSVTTPWWYEQFRTMIGLG